MKIRNQYDILYWIHATERIYIEIYYSILFAEILID